MKFIQKYYVLFLAIVVFFWTSASKSIAPTKNLETKKQNEDVEVKEVDVNELLAFEWWEKLKASNSAELQILNKVAKKIEVNYVDADRVKPPKMFVSALESLEKNIPEVLVTEKDKKVRLEIKGKVKYFNEKFSELKNTLSELKQVYDFVKENVIENISSDDLEFYLAQGFVDSLDPHTLMLSKDVFSEMKLTTSGEFEGLGIVITIKKGILTVVAPIEGGPAYKAGIKADDNIVRINDESTVNMNLTEAVSKMRGPKGTKITVYILREGLTNPISYTIKRDVIVVKSVSSKLLPGGVGYIRLSQFQGHTSEDLEKQIDILKKKTSLFNGLILDLRNNPGGLLDEAVKVSDLFLDDGVIVTAVGMQNRLFEEHKAKEGSIVSNVPIVVLVNPGSASASEIVAGAIKYNNRGIIVGSKTFGKGTVQTVIDLKNGTALKMTIAKYLTTGMNSIQNIGIIPDIALVPAIMDDSEIILYRDAHVSKENDLENNFEEDDQTEFPPSKYKVRYLKVEKKEDGEKSSKRIIVSEEEKEDIEKDDYEIKFAADLIRKIHIVDREKFLEEFGLLQANIVLDNDEAIKTALIKKGIDWSKGENPEKPNLELNLNMEGGYFKAGDEVNLSLTLVNKGDKSLYRMWVLSESDSIVFNRREFIFGNVLPGQSITRSIKLKIPENMNSNIEDVTFTLFDENKLALRNVKKDIAIRGEPLPQFIFSYQIVDNCKTCDGDGIADAGEDVLVKGFVKNIGEGDAKDVMAIIKNLNGKEIFLKKGREKIGKLIVKQDKEFSFNFSVSKDYGKESFEMEFTIVDVELDAGITNKVAFDIGKISGANIKQGNYYFEVDRQVPIFTDIGKNKRALYFLNKVQTVYCDRVYDNKFYRVRLGREDFGFIDKDSFIPIAKKKAVSTVSSKDLISFYQMIPPEIDITNIDDLAKVKKDEIEFILRIRDEKAVKDVIIYVNNEKVFYGHNSSGSKEFDISTAIPISDGNNRIVVVSRDNENLSSSKILTIRKLPGNKILTIR